jgi:transcriptional antiterminator RfaH
VTALAGLLDGAFVDCIGLFEGMTDGERVIVLLDLFNSKVRVALEGFCLTPA